ncbi:MAG: hypothetical protein EPN25_04260 [Nitrospirae bacterium]|nr:MAG: hypothetical protein EPN25_04260 [Nitrospirota bacterium]
MKRHDVLSEKGFVKGLLILFILVGIVFVGISFGRPYIRYNTLKSHTKDILTIETSAAPERIKGLVMEEAKALKVPLSEENLTVTIDSKKFTRVKGRWSETVNFWDYYSRKFDFEMDVEL